MTDLPSQQVQRPRQEPVSCESCRKKKLKCSREQPCSNCVARDMPCVFAGRRGPAPPPSVANDDVIKLQQENATIQARLERLEHMVLNGSVDSQDIERPAKARKTGGQDVTFPSPATTVSSHADHELAKSYRGDFQFLEDVGMRENTRFLRLSFGMPIRIVKLEYIIAEATSEKEERCILLPSEHESMLLFDSYIEHLDPAQHVVHLPTTRRSFKRLYQDLKANRKVEPGQAVLLLTILSSVSSYWALAECSVSIFESTQQSLSVAMHWLRAVLDILEHIRRSSSATLETIQAAILVVFLIYHIEGYSPKVRYIQGSTIAMAKDLGLHKTDRVCTLSQTTSQADIVNLEIRRRIWWHLASTDWNLAVTGGPHDSTYTVNPRHMRVKKPRNVSDEELETQPANFSHPLYVPTVMAYYLQRIKIGEICRDIADLFWTNDVDNIAVEEIGRVDAQFQTLLNELPPFLSLTASPEEHRRLDAQHPHATLQRYIANLCLQARRCKFHLPFLIRAAQDPSCLFSRNICLESARSIVRLRKDIEAERSMKSLSWIANFRLVGILHMFFYAAVVLAMDLCIHRGATDEHERKQEIREACNVLEQSKAQSSAAGMFLDSVMAVLHKHRIRLQGQEHVAEPGNTVAVAPGTTSDTFALYLAAPAERDTLSDDAQGMNNIDFDVMWRSYIDLEGSLDPQSWDALFSDLGNVIE